ncbi:MAG: hypothetical protein GC136_10050 [Alphaproteobacteria bacterium]|nr:hypothetical protein [Alphaproteobacteria bacterium]
MKRGALALCFLMTACGGDGKDIAEPTSMNVDVASSPVGAPRQPLHFDDCPATLPSYAQLETADFYTQPLATRTIWCMMEQLETAPESRDYVRTTREYLQELGVTDSQWESLAPYLPENFHFVDYNFSSATGVAAGAVYLNTIENSHLPSFWEMRVRLLFLGIMDGESYRLGLPQNDFTERDDGYIFMPSPDETDLNLGHMNFVPAYRQTEEYRRDMLLLIFFHEIGHYIEGSQGHPFSNYPNYSEASPDIIALGALAFLRGRVTPAMQDFTMWRDMSSLNTIIGMPDCNIATTHSTGTIIRPHYETLLTRTDFSTALLDEAFDTHRLIQVPAFVKFNENSIRDSVAEAATLICSRNENGPNGYRQRMTAAQTLAREIDQGTLHVHNFQTRTVLENYIRAMTHWYPDQIVLTTPEQTQDGLRPRLPG